MGVAQLLRYTRLAFFSKESTDRELFQTVRRRRVSRIVEVGIDAVERTAQALRLARDASGNVEVRYAGFDRFEERGADQPALPLITAHRALGKTGATVRLTPGEPAAAVAAIANSLADTDLILVSGTLTAGRLAPLWPFLPRMCHPETVVLRAQDDAWEELDPAALDHAGAARAA